jgi:hypothetical protein
VLLGQSLNFNPGMAAVFRAVREASPEPHFQKENNHNGCTMGCSIKNAMDSFANNIQDDPV